MQTEDSEMALIESWGNRVRQRRYLSSIRVIPR